jgi:pSer/pThr/pTyr-binding forkhead associated (FHA) protein
VVDKSERAPWTEESRRGSFESFFASAGKLDRAEFLARYDTPFLMTAVSADSATWSATLVLRIAPKPGAARIAISAADASDLESAAGRIHVGRTPENEVVIAAPTVSKRHAYFTRRDISWEITDAGSSNGTLLEGHRLRPHRRERIRRSLATIEFGPDARFVFMTPESTYELIEEIRRSRGLKAEAAVKATSPPRPADLDDFESIRPEEPEGAASSGVVSVHPIRPPTPPPPAPRHRATWQPRRSDSLDKEDVDLSKSTDKINVPVGKTPEEAEAINFDYALRAVTSLGALIHKLEAVLRVQDQVVLLMGEGSKNSIPECEDALIKMRPLIRSIRMELTVGDRKPVEIFRAQS